MRSQHYHEQNLWLSNLWPGPRTSKKSFHPEIYFSGPPALISYEKESHYLRYLHIFMTRKKLHLKEEKVECLGDLSISVPLKGLRLVQPGTGPQRHQRCRIFISPSYTHSTSICFLLFFLLLNDIFSNISESNFIILNCPWSHLDADILLATLGWSI